MADPKIQDGYTRFAHEMLETFARTRMAPIHYQIIFLAARMSWGWKRKYWAGWTVAEVANRIGRDRSETNRAIRRMIEVKLLRLGPEGELGIQSDHDEWGYSEASELGLPVLLNEDSQSLKRGLPVLADDQETRTPSPHDEDSQSYFVGPPVLAARTPSPHSTTSQRKKDKKIGEIAKTTPPPIGDRVKAPLPTAVKPRAWIPETLNLDPEPGFLPDGKPDTILNRAALGLKSWDPAAHPDWKSENFRVRDRAAEEWEDEVRANATRAEDRAYRLQYGQQEKETGEAYRRQDAEEAKRKAGLPAQTPQQLRQARRAAALERQRGVPMADLRETEHMERPPRDADGRLLS